MRVGRPITAPLATHEGKDTGIHNVGTRYVAESSIKDVDYASHKARHQNGGADEIDLGGLNVSSTLIQTHAGRLARRNINSSWLELEGGLNYSAVLGLYGKDHAWTGCIALWVPNAAGTGYTSAFKISGLTDTPEVIVGTIPVPRLKQAKGRVTGTIPAGSSVGVILNAYSFFPNTIATVTIDLRAYANPTEITDEVGRFNLYNPSATDGTYWIRWDYLTSSGEPEIWIGFDRDNKVVAIWQSDDTPSFRPPIDAEFITSLARINLPIDVYNTLGALSLGDVSLKPTGIALKTVDTLVLPMDKALIIKERKVIKVIPTTEEIEYADPVSGETIREKLMSTKDIISWEETK